jgi:hypothetical protein
MMTTLPLASLIEAEDYNNIIECTKEIPFSNDNILEAGEILRRHGLEYKFGVLFVHRHFDMPPRSIAIKTAICQDIEIIQFFPIAAIAQDEIRGTSYKLLKNGKFQAFEHYVRGEAETEIPESFANELAEFILQNHLEEVLGLFCRDEHEDGVELNLYGQKIGVKIPIAEVPQDILSETTTTGWVFSSAQNEQPVYGCSHSSHSVGDKHRLPVIEAALRKRGLMLSDIVLTPESK